MGASSNFFCPVKKASSDRVFVLSSVPSHPGRCKCHLKFSPFLFLEEPTTASEQGASERPGRFNIQSGTEPRHPLPPIDFRPCSHGDRITSGVKRKTGPAPGFIACRYWCDDLKRETHLCNAFGQVLVSVLFQINDLFFGSKNNTRGVEKRTRESRTYGLNPSKCAYIAPPPRESQLTSTITFFFLHENGSKFRKIIITIAINYDNADFPTIID